MNVKRWIARREPNWKRLDELLTRIEKRGLRSLSTEEIKALASLYRSVSADLARARTHQTLVGHTIVQDLQRLTSRGYSQVYQGSRKQEWKSAIDFYKWGLPEVIQQTSAYTAIATGLFLLGGLIAWWFSWRDPQFLALVVPDHLIRTVRDEGKLWMGSILGSEPTAASQIMTNNLGVTFKAVAGGMTIGVFTMFILFMNGLLIGGVGTLVAQNNLAFPFWAFVFPHGSLELPAIFFSGGAGLLIARGILFPGQYRRIDAIKVYSVKAAQLMFGVIPLLIVAGVIEGFFSPSPIVPDPLKYLVGIGLFIALVRYCSRRRSTQSA
ncbi:stage II sporulation protein M [Leptolyngbya sp. FACHB-17]|uniref:stage II sporulation protein M n=1 Tax=unclassified Leptolyngbya TaxID=2650499 RepID=UPI0016815428|nr:stage II sporulation protein M [Leptolyngbya sp. FACHB-17]MBD2078848.1 stage II sporulation protein M [Leptolyngbya sp. FACHB-17]